MPIYGYNRALTGLFEYAIFTFIMSWASVLIMKLGHFLSWVCIVWTLGGAFGLSYNDNMNICCSSHCHWILAMKVVMI